MNNLFENNGAFFSEGRTHRYALWRIWDKTLQNVLFIGLNPSTANETKDDPTIRRVKKFAADWGYGGVIMLNLFTYVTSDPSKLRFHDTYTDNSLSDIYLMDYSKKCNKVIFAWGSFPEAIERAKKVIAIFPLGEALVINKDGSPRHPLYVPGNTKPVLYNNIHNNMAICLLKSYNCGHFVNPNNCLGGNNCHDYKIIVK